MKRIWNDFKAFALKGNVLDMAVGVIVGGAFGKIVSSVVNDLVMPLFGYLVSGMDFASLKLVLSPAHRLPFGQHHLPALRPFCVPGSDRGDGGLSGPLGGTEHFL